MADLLTAALPPWLASRLFFRADLSLLVYHGVIQKRGDLRLERNLHLLSDFQLQMKFLARQSIAPLSKVSADLPLRGRASRSTAVITFDDGYANNLAAADTLSKAGLPWTLFISTGAIGTHGVIWTVELSLLLLHGQAGSLEALGQTWPLSLREEREAVFQAIRSRLKAMPAKLRRDTMREIQAQFPAGETQRLLQQFPAFRMLTWAEIRQLAGSGVEIGSHGVEHEIHHATQDSAVRRQELSESKKEIERQIGKPCRFFAFPNGETCELSSHEVEEAGYELALTTRPGFVRRDSPRFLLPRISPGGSVAKLKQQWRDLYQK